MKHSLPLATVLALMAGCLANAQSYVGHVLDNYSGVHGLLINPASVVDSRQRADINLFSISAFGGSDYFSTDLNAILESEEGFSFDDNMQMHLKDENQFFLNVDILGPSFMFNLSPRSSIGVTTRVRAFMNLNNINGELYEKVEEGFGPENDLDFDMRNFSGTIHSWGEYGLTYGRILMDGNRHFLKAGITLKYLQGAGSTYTSSSDLSGQYTASSQSLTTTGGLQYGSTSGFDSNNIDFENMAGGFGGDLGLVYEFRRGYEQDSLGYSDYKMKVGISVTDIGSISYDGSTVTSYDMDGITTSTEDYDGGDIEAFLKERYSYNEEITESEISLPTAMHIVLDYNFRKRLYMSLHGSLSLIGNSERQASRVINTLTATPRYESRWFSFYLPVSIRQYDGIAMGAGFRLGPLTVGSGSIITNYISDDSQTADIYVGLKIPIYR